MLFPIFPPTIHFCCPSFLSPPGVAHSFRHGRHLTRTEVQQHKLNQAEIHPPGQKMHYTAAVPWKDFQAQQGTPTDVKWLSANRCLLPRDIRLEDGEGRAGINVSVTWKKQAKKSWLPSNYLVKIQFYKEQILVVCIRCVLELYKKGTECMNMVHYKYPTSLRFTPAIVCLGPRW